MRVFGILKCSSYDDEYIYTNTNQIKIALYFNLGKLENVKLCNECVISYMYYLTREFEIICKC